MAIMRMMQVAINQVVDVIPMWHGGMTAVRPMHMVSIMTRAVVGHAAYRVGVGDLNHMLIVVVFVSTVQVAVVQIAGVIAVLDGNMPTVRAVLVRVVLVNNVRH
ncbi:MAG: hypothetical protein AAGG11_17835 [Pseudomonadota bacterium]